MLQYQKELLSLLFQDFPESFIFALAVFALLRLRFDYKKILIVAILQTFTNLIRLLPIAFGVHTLILIITLAVYVRLVTKEKITKIFGFTILVFVILLSMQILYAEPLLNITHLSYEDVNVSPLLRGIFCLPYEIVLLGLAIFLNYKNKKLNRFNTTTSERRL
ncbi:hypothetical protein Psch_02801 [Pelotomaculum schinkii]|uniref:Uncharacterized protein n=1 Tax=Pelotomaculum schinkii TaxID=78350 RepID=A0A4Y7RAR0_9FIRM|nr:MULTISPECIES: hypothetical protein [Pelotomaculum]TEB05760.1 hypothetical protein Psch_02801 [Pelotomaculum schinkii]TEB17930.1 hypothetical protein Psfp_00053 [Pelotomaculum sp. FP]